jgi:lipoprotein-releasing system ATP-binding protein
MSPDLVLADKPTGNLDTQCVESVFDLVRDVNRERGTTILMVTHNLDLAKRCDRIVDVVEGRMTD